MKLHKIELTQTHNGEIIERKSWVNININFKRIESLFGIKGMQYIDCGLEPNDGTGDSIRTAIQKVNANFALVESWQNAAE